LIGRRSQLGASCCARFVKWEVGREVQRLRRAETETEVVWESEDVSTRQRIPYGARSSRKKWSEKN
jgi:hypothetical protein